MLTLAIAALLAFPQDAQNSQGAQPEKPSPIQVQGTAVDSLLPHPKGPLVLAAADAESPLTVAKMVESYCSLTGLNVITDSDTRSLLEAMQLNLFSPMEIPAEEVQTSFETILRQKDFTLRILRSGKVGLLEISSLNTAARNNLRAGAMFLEPGQLDVAARHPAMLFTTVVHLPNLDVRQVSNSMRTMITDANTQQMLPAGNSNSMVLVGFGDSVVALAESLEVINAASAVDSDERRPTTEIVRLNKATAADLVQLLNGALGIDPEARRASDPAILADGRTNSLLITARSERLGGIKDLITALDV